MNKMIAWLEGTMAPKMNQINNNIWVQTLKDSMMQMLPLILVGSLVTLLAILQEYIPLPNMWTVSNYTMGLIGLIVSFLVPFNYMERKRLRNLRIVAGMSGLSIFLITIRFDNLAELQYSLLGAGGMFAALILGIVAGTVFAIFGKFSFFKEDSAMPDFVRQWFDNMLPVGLLVFGTWGLVYLLNVDLFNIITIALSPLTNFAETLPGFVLIYFLFCFFYSMGISTWMMYPIVNPIAMAGIAANTALVAQGLEPTFLLTNETLYLGWLCIGGTGGTLILNFLMLRAKSKRMRALGKACIVPGFLNINEPIVFGAVAWNPILMVPMWIHGIVAPAIVWFALKGGFAAIPAHVNLFWYCPYPISTWLVSQSVGGMILLAIVVAVNFLIFYPFFKVYDKQQLKEEQAQAAK
ncbi:MAG: PTS transporter subunit EIIC [Deferribacteraceae bacterium]|jgi:PTS system cellobiose-specific IIC component|nr:PTS transporter subunit EIIC [Deferribacteraceae bacterium]